MAYNGSGTFNRIHDWTSERDAGNNIDSTKMDAEDDGFAAGLSNAVTKDGQTTITADLPMAGYKHTGVGEAAARNQYAAVSQIQDGDLVLLGSVSGTDTITASASPSISAYTTGMTFRFAAAGANTGAVTLNVNSAGAKAITKAGTTALVAGDIASGAVVEVVYDGTRFQLVNSRNISAFGASLIDDGNSTVALATLGAQADLITTRGDLIRGDSSGDAERYALGTSGYVLKSDGTDLAWADPLTLTVRPYILLQDQKAQNTDGGTFTSGAWRTRALAEVTDTDSLCSVSSNQITLAAGTYECSISCPGSRCGSHQAKLYNTTGTADVLIGTSEQITSGADSQSRSFISGRFTIAGSQALEVQHRCTSTRSTDGLGKAANLTTEIYTVAEFWRVA